MPRKKPPIKGSNLKYLIGKLKPISRRVSEMEAELEPMQDELQGLTKAARGAAGEAWIDAVERAANEWKSTNGDEELSIEWVDDKYGQIPPEVFEYINASASRYGRQPDETETDLLSFYNAVLEEIEGEDG